MKFYDLKEVAEILGKSTRSVRRFIKSGELQAYMIGGTYRIKLSDLEDFIEKSKKS